MYQQLKYSSLATLLLLTSIGSVLIPIHATPTLAQVVQQQPLSQRLQFTGTAEPAIAPLRGGELGDQAAKVLFKNAEWVFYPDGRFIYLPAHEPGVPDEKKFSIVGTYFRRGDTLDFQGVRLAGGDTLSIDGTIQQNGYTNTLEVIYAVSKNRQAQQIAIVTQSLTPQSHGLASPIDIGKFLAASKLSFQTPQQAQALPNPRIKVIAGIPVSDLYDVTLEGKTGDQTFSAVPARIFTQEFDPKQPDASIVTLTPTGDIVNGWGYWNTLGSPEVLKATKTTVNNGQIHITLNSQIPTTEVGWHTILKSGTADQVVPAFAEKATLTLTFQGDRVTGELRATGLYSTSTAYNQPSTYVAKITGQRQKSILVDSLRETLGTSSFTGQWETTVGELGRIQLQQTGQQVKGTYTGFGGGTIKGTVQGNRLNFTWEDKQQGKGQGFFRAIAGGGTLSGELHSGNNRKLAQTIIANWQLPPQLTTQSLSPLDLQELRYLGDDLLGQGRCEQAVVVLQRVADDHRMMRQKEGVGELREDTQLNNEIYLLNQMMNCSFQVGNYKALLERLDQALEVGQLVTPAESAKRTFRQEILDVVKALNFSKQLFQTLQTSLKDLPGTLSFVGVGLQFEQNETTKINTITGVTPNRPAAKAGIRPQDVLVTIDGKSIQGLTSSQISERLRGTEGTLVIATVRRNNQQLTFKVIRERIEVRPKNRSLNDLSQDVNFLLTYLDRKLIQINHNLEQIKTLEQDIANGKIDPLQALDNLTEDLDKQRLTLIAEADEIVTQSKNLLKGQEQLSQIWNKSLSVSSAMTVNHRQCGLQSQRLDYNPKETAALEEEFSQALKQNTELTEAEKFLLDRQGRTISQIHYLVLQFDCDRNGILRRDTRERFQEDLKEAIDASIRYSTRLEAWRQRLVTDTDRIDVQEQGQPFYQKLVPFLIGLNQTNEALLISERSRARAFADLLLLRSLADAPNPTTVANSKPITLEQIQQTAKTQNATLIQYFRLDRDLYIWVIQSNGNITFHKADPSKLQAPLSQLVKDSRAAIGARGRASGGPAAAPTSLENQHKYLRELHRLLIEPIAAALPKDENQRIIIMPHGELFLVPFAALIDTNGQYLIDRHTIVTAPSIDILARSREQRERILKQSEHQTALVVGNPTMPKVGSPPVELDSLPGAEDEAREIAKMLNTQPILGAQATEGSVVQQMTDARIIHLATHGLLDRFQGQTPGAIALAPSGDNDSNDGLLTSGEIYNLKLNAELVVLSACDTGGGDISGDGILGLSRTFFAAGVPSMLVSLWKVPDQPTAELMTAFYRNWRGDRKLDKAQAIRQAMLETKKQHPKPLDWAAFVLMGEAE